jgi:hypothetical protein
VLKYEFDFRKTKITEMAMTSGYDNLDQDDEYMTTI